MNSVSRVCCAGEVMIEMAPLDAAGTYRRGVAGDTYNTAVYLARQPGCRVSYLSQLGDDPCSASIIRQLLAENIDATLVRRVPGRQPGLYMIDNDADGERHFTYWRSHSPARDTFATVPEVGEMDAFYFSGITLAVCRSGLDNLVALLGKLRRSGCRILFDPNYRPALWDSVAQARSHYLAVLGLCDTVLPTLQDDSLLWDIDAVEDCAQFYRGNNVREVVVKAPDLRVHAYAHDEVQVLAGRAVSAVDTTGAGDAFNAGYLAARLRGDTLAEAIAAGQALAASVVQHRGAIIPHQQMPHEEVH